MKISSLWWRIATTVLIGVVVVAAWSVGGYRVQIPTVLMIFALLGVAWWIFSNEQDSAQPIRWPFPDSETLVTRSSADIDTRRIASMLNDAQPGRGSDSLRLQRFLTARVVERLSRSGKISKADSFTQSRDYLSPGLYEFLSSVEPMAVSRRVQRSYIKEIEQL